MVTMSATTSIGENPSISSSSPANPPGENKMETTKRPRRYNFSLPTFSWGTQRVIPWVKDPSSIPSDAALPPLPPRKPSSEKEKEKEKQKEKEEVAEIPWNLRKRRGDSSSPVVNGAAVGLAAPVAVAKEKVQEKGKKIKLSVALSSMEIREDFLLMKGKKPASRPKKRAKHVQKIVDEIFPGLWLSEVTADLYKVDEEEVQIDEEEG